MPATILQKKTPIEWQIRYHFCVILQGFYSEYWKKYNSDSQYILLGIQTLLHIYQIGWARGYSIRRILILCKNAQMYFFEYLSQWNHMGIPLRIQDLLIFIYDHVLFDEEVVIERLATKNQMKYSYSIESIDSSNPINWSPKYEISLHELTIILTKPPKMVEKPTVKKFETFYNILLKDQNANHNS
jgi:hypothetical protein